MDDAESGLALPGWAAEAVGSNVSRAVLWPPSSQRSWGERPKVEGPVDTLRPQNVLSPQNGSVLNSRSLLFICICKWVPAHRRASMRGSNSLTSSGT